MNASELQVVVIKSLSVDMYSMLKNVHHWLVDPKYNPQKEGLGLPADWIKSIVAKCEGRTAILKKMEGEGKGG
jgi:hypothetical protein